MAMNNYMKTVAERVSGALSRGLEQVKTWHTGLQYGKLARKHSVALVIGACVVTVFLLAVGLAQSGGGGEKKMHIKRAIVEPNITPNITTPGGAVYTRWGRTTCPGVGTKLVYAGYTAGSHYTHAGSGANHLCLPEHPEFDEKNDAVGNAGLIYGTEYEVPAGSFPFDPSHATDDATLLDHNVPCAVCLSCRPTVLMIPAKKTCPADWVLEYSGYVMSERHNHQRSEYICVDRAPEADDAGYRNENGALLYSVEGKCGALPCPPYVDGWELACAVCTR